MKKLFPALFLASALAIPAALAAADFEGKVHMQMSSGKKDEVQEMDYRVKDGLVRIDVQVKEKSGKPSGATPGIIMDTKKQEMTILMPDQQMYMVRSLAPTANGRPGAAPEGTGNGKASDSDLEKTGETETILGYKCEKFIIKSDKTTIAMWLTSDLGNFMGLGAGASGGFGGRRGGGGGNSAQAQAWEEALKGKSVFPMRVVGSDTAGKETYRLQVTSVEKQSLPASDFTAPDGWQKLDMANMMKGMMPGGR
jgi:Domain of unknown function (DUF4412)